MGYSFGRMGDVLSRPGPGVGGPWASGLPGFVRNCQLPLSSRALASSHDETPRLILEMNEMGDFTSAYNGVVSGDDGQTHVAHRDDRMRALLDAHFMFIWRLLRRFGVPRNDLDDAVQQVFIVASGRLADI